VQGSELTEIRKFVGFFQALSPAFSPFFSRACTCSASWQYPLCACVIAYSGAHSKRDLVRQGPELQFRDTEKRVELCM
jgi:hypothetical protein